MITIGKLDGTRVLTIPVMPSSFEITSEQDHQTVNVVSLGEILLKGHRKLKSLSFSSFFPAQKYSFADTSETKPYNLVDKIEKLKNDGTSIRLSIDKSKSMTCVIQSFTYSENDGTGDVSYTLTFIEERKINGERAHKTVKAKKYVCKEGDNFYKIARKTTGSTSNAKKIAKINKMKVNAKLKKGKKLVIKL